MDGIPLSQIDTVHRLKDLVLAQIEVLYTTEFEPPLRYSIRFRKDNGTFIAQAVAYRASGIGYGLAGRSEEGFVGALGNLWKQLLSYVSADFPLLSLVWL